MFAKRSRKAANNGGAVLAINERGYDWFFFSSRRRHTRFDCDWSSDVCSSDLAIEAAKQVKGYSIGYVGDMSKRAPDAVPMSIVWNMSPIFNAFVKDVETGKFDNA